MVTVFLHTDTGNMEAYSSTDAFFRLNSGYIRGSTNDNGDILVEVASSNMWNRTIGYLQTLRVEN